MRLFHVSEEPDISIFHPRIPNRCDLDQSVGLVWAIDEARLPNFLTPRDCPRVAYYASTQTTDEDRKRFFSLDSVFHAVIIEKRWLQTMSDTTLYLYEFQTEDFVLQDSNAGYYVAKTAQIPKAKHVLTDLVSELNNRGVELYTVDHLWDIAEAVKKSSLCWSLCRMRNALPREY